MTITCIIDLFGCAGHLDEAEDFIQEQCASVWGTLLGTMKFRLDIEPGEHVVQHRYILEFDNIGCYVLLSNVYLVVGRWEGVPKVRTMIEDKRLEMKLLESWMELD